MFEPLCGSIEGSSLQLPGIVFANAICFFSANDRNKRRSVLALLASKRERERERERFKLRLIAKSNKKQIKPRL